MLLLVVAIGYGAYSVIPPESLERFQTAGDDETSVNRLVRWEAGYEIYKEHPFVGIGPNNFWYYYVSNFPREEGSEGWGLSHNTFVDVLAEHGTVGALLYLCLIAANFLLNRQTRAVAAQTGRTFSRDVAYGLDCAMIACVVSSFFMSVLHYPTFWMHLAMTVSLNNVIRRGAGQVA
jgi:O-antigen ligase